MNLPRKDIIQDYADMVTKDKSSPEAILLAEIIRQSKKSGYIESAEFYKSAPGILNISKDSYRRTMASLKKKNLIEKYGYCIKLLHHDELTKPFTSLTINQTIQL